MGSEAAVAAYLERFEKSVQTLYEKYLESGRTEDFRKLLIKWGLTSCQSAYQAVWEQAIPEALRAGDWEALHRCFFQSSRMHLLPRLSGGFDHCARLWALLDATTCEGAALLSRVLPPELGLSQNGHPMLVHGTNLLLCLLHNTPEHTAFDPERVIAGAEKFTATKHPLWERSVVGFLLALLRRDTAGMTEQLQAACSSYGKISCEKYRKLQCVSACGLLILARDLLPEEQFRQIGLPRAANFSQAYFTWRLSHPEVENRLYFPYPESLDTLNRALLHPVAVQEIYQPYLHTDNPLLARHRRTWHLNEDAMLEALVQDLPPLPQAEGRRHKEA